MASEALTDERDLTVEMWCRIDLMPPAKSGYYRVQDYDCKTGVAFLNPNREWTAIEGRAQKPYFAWMDIR